ncbi:hypothetical protein BDU57DRAFT_203922 [Ampelomyces quisqualis]|uniref:Oxidase ustYa n=1 Tax=Ampelomyces quisqualis TaxID=50730 RepID=A0A6A5QT42_AMPQU|nr:hypothetical protein BDU57DRAFT_203922 [Ampelomyces quisqualis]
MPFNYAKVDFEGAEHRQSSIEPVHTHAERGRSTMWSKIFDSLRLMRWLAAFFLLSALLICQISILRRQPISYPIGSEMNGLVPHFSHEQKIFRADGRYASDHTTMESINATKKNWMDLMPPGGGFLDVQDYTSHTLPPPMHFDQNPGGQIYSIAVFHELHCLMHLSSYVDQLVMQIRNRDFTLDESDVGHNDHCFNYIRNALICCGDTTLEGQSQAKMFEHIAGTDGTGAVHVCRNYDEISAWATKHRITDKKEAL